MVLDQRVGLFAVAMTSDKHLSRLWDHAIVLLNATSQIHGEKNFNKTIDMPNGS